MTHNPASLTRLVLLGFSSALFAHAVPAGDLPEIRVPRTDAVIVADGKLDEAAWTGAARLTLGDFWAQTSHPLETTEVLLLRTSKALHIAFIAADREILATRTDRDDRTHRDDCVEIFLARPRETNGDALALEINALGTTADYYYRHAGWINFGWEPSVVRITSQRNPQVPLTPPAPAPGFIVEVEIPWPELLYALPEKEVPPRLRANFARWNYGRGGRIFTIWSDPRSSRPTPLVPDRFGWLIFEE
ncbi:MAG: hypothetical protein K0R17_2464 [Rariglobus sp.]|jgi:hypothetical protein|nr:hypothetical protein [Rariglobus sp.]